MDTHDWSQVQQVQSSLRAVLKVASAQSARLVQLQDELKPIYEVLPKNSEGQLNNGTSRYALHRYFSEKHGWAVKGMQPAGAAWMATMSVTDDVKDITKYMVPAYMQHALLSEIGKTSFDLKSLATMAATIEHLIHAEVLATLHSIYTTLELPIPGDRSEQQVRDILETYVMIHAFGVNLDVSVLEDVRRAKAHLEKTHASWPGLKAYVWEVKNEMFAKGSLSFVEIEKVVTRFGEKYVRWQGEDCSRAKTYLTGLPSHQKGRVKLGEVKTLENQNGRRELFSESADDVEKLGVLTGGKDANADFIIANYLNSQSMCLSTSSYFTACCVNECEGLLAKLEREVRAPEVQPTELARLVKTLPSANIEESLLQEIPGLATSSGLVPLHSRKLASWMHRAFPLACPAPHDQIITNPKTPDEWMGASGKEVAKLEEMMEEISQVLKKYTTMGKPSRNYTYVSDDTDPDTKNEDIIRISPTQRPAFQKTSGRRWILLPMLGGLAAIVSVMAMGMETFKAVLSSIGKDKKSNALDEFGVARYM
jgi:hypothetical protein